VALLVDADTHVEVALEDLARFMDQPVRREVECGTPGSLLPGTLGAPPGVGHTVQNNGDSRGGGGRPEADYAIVFPGLLRTMAFHPSVRLEAGITLGYARWLTDVYLPAHPRARGMLYLPIRDSEACCRVVEEFGAAPGVAGAFLTNLPALQPFANEEMPLYRMLEERALPLAFHPAFLWTEPPLTVFDSYAAAYAYAHPFIQTAHLMNWMLSGMPERFPGLPCVFYGAGVAWLNFVAHRLDQGYMRRPSEAPLLTHRPSHYMRRYFYCTQPVDREDGTGYLEGAVRMIGSGQLIYGSNLPEWDVDTPQAIRRLAFLDEAEQAAILGSNAARLFRLPAGS
jgi:predicted TIM-barrel fold metal-dependent hydrolase